MWLPALCGVHYTSTTWTVAIQPLPNLSSSCLCLCKEYHMMQTCSTMHFTWRGWYSITRKVHMEEGVCILEESILEWDHGGLHADVRWAVPLHPHSTCERGNRWHQHDPCENHISSCQLVKFPSHPSPMPLFISLCVTTEVFFFLLTHQTAHDHVQILLDSFIWLTCPHSDSTLDPDLRSLSDLTHCLLILIGSDSYAYWCSLSSLLILTQLAYWWSLSLLTHDSFPCI